jgi:hypothetical protein
MHVLCGSSPGRDKGLVEQEAAEEPMARKGAWQGETRYWEWVLGIGVGVMGRSSNRRISARGGRGTVTQMSRPSRPPQELRRSVHVHTHFESV